MTFGVTIAILIDGFNQLKAEHENINEEDDKTMTTQLSMKKFEKL